jgi:hypothetical protein
MISPAVEELEARLRLAAESRRFDEVRQLSVELGQQVREYVNGLPKGDPRGAGASRRLLETLSWTLIMMQAARSSCLGELRRVATANCYSSSNTQAEGAAGLRIEG